MDPINYLGMVPQVDLGRQFLTGLQAGAGIGEIQQQADARQLAIQQKQLAMQRAQQYQSDLSSAFAAPRDQQAQLFTQLAMRNPDQYEAVTKGFGALSADQQKNELRDTYTIASTLHADRPDLALQQIDERITAHKNSGQPTAELEALRGVVEKDPKAAYSQVLHLASALPGGDKILSNLSAATKYQSEADQAPAALRTANAKAGAEEADVTTKNLGIVAQKAGALAKPGVKPTQAITMFKSLEARGIIPKGGAQGYIDGIPTDAKALPDYLKQVQASGMKPDDQMKFTTPTADAALSANTQVQTTGMNNRTQLAVQDRIDARAKAESENGDDAASFTPQAIDNAAARYNTDGTLPPMGVGKAAAAGRTKILNRAAEMKLGVSPEQQRIDQLSNKGDIAARNASVLDFSSKGKSGQALQAANTSLNHLETVEQLAMAQRNGNTRLFNQMANKLAAEFGGTAPTNLNAALSMVAPEVSKAVIGAAGTGEERAAFEHRFASNGSPEQALQGIGTIKELLGGRLTESQRTYERTTKKTDFDSMLSPAAKRVLDRAHHAAHDGPAVGAVDGGFRFKGGDPSKQSSWEKI